MGSEDTVLDLIALSANALKGVRVFQKHPSNIPSKSPLHREGLDHARTYALLRTDVINEEGRAISKEGGESENNVETDLVVDRSQASDIDQLFSLFTPRLCWQNSDREEDSDDPVPP